MSLKGTDGRVWYVKYSIGAPPRKRVVICSGWKKFSRENHLREGDVCVFEVASNRAEFNVTIFRITDEQDHKNKPHGVGHANKGNS